MAAVGIIVWQNFPIISEVLTNNEDAFLANPDSLSDLNDCLKRALQLDYPNKIAENARRKAFEVYTW